MLAAVTNSVEELAVKRPVAGGTVMPEVEVTNMPMLPQFVVFTPVQNAEKG